VIVSTVGHAVVTQVGVIVSPVSSVTDPTDTAGPMGNVTRCSDASCSSMWYEMV
jgi:hypothetical protein